MILKTKCLCISLAFVFTKSFLDACLFSQVEFIARNAISLTIDWSEAEIKEDDVNCHVRVKDGEDRCESEDDDGIFFDGVVRLKNGTAVLWLTESPSNSQNITICSKSQRQSQNPKFISTHRTSAKDGVPPLFHDCFFVQNDRKAEFYMFDNHWIHAYSVKDIISYFCIFQENFSEKRLEWCKLDKCEAHEILSDRNATLFTVPALDDAFEGTYYAVLENEFGRTESPRATWKKAFQNRDNQGQKVFVEQGDQATIACNIQSSIPKVDPSQVSWVWKDGGSWQTVTLGNTRVRSLDGFLVIFEASPDMNGTYACEVRNDVLGETMIDNPTTLTVGPKDTLRSERPVTSLNTGHRDAIFSVAGKVAVLQCLFTGRPAPTVLWYKGDTGVPIVHDGVKYYVMYGNMTLFIVGVTNDDGGVYKCMASNGIGKGEYKNINLIVQEPPVLLENMISMNASKGDNVTFHCKYSGEPKPTSVWIINGNAATKYQGVKISETPSGSKLEMFEVDENSTSSIRCSAANKLGEVSAYAYLKVFQTTRIKAIVETVIEAKDLSSTKSVCKTFTCVVVTDPRTILRIEWFANKTKISGRAENEAEGCTFRELNDELNVTCPKANLPLEVTCQASNGISSAKKSRIIHHDHPQSALSMGHHSLFRENPWLIYTVVAVGSVVLILFISAAVLAKKSMHRKKKADISQSQMSVLGNNYKPSCSDNSTASQGISPHLKKDLINIISSLLIPRSSLELKKCIGNGHFGRVYMAALVHQRQICEIVAVKTMKYKAEESEMVELFLKEAVLMKDFQHQHVLGIKGIAFADDATPMVVLPYMANGDLRNYILNPELNITILNLLIMGMQVACGMNYLSKHHFVHRDLAARNCMVNENGVVKIADFGMSRQLISCDYYRVENGKDPVPIRWMAPECLEAKIFTTKSDVWAYGVLLWELMTRGAVPYPDAENWQVASLIQSGCLLRQPPFCPNVVYSMMTRCWIQESSKRPSFEQLLEEMEEVVNVVPAEVRRDSQNYNNVFN